MFARRALSKINELHELELASINGEQGTQALEFREATIKVIKSTIQFICLKNTLST